VSIFGWFVGLVVPVRDFCSALAALVVPVQNKLFLAGKLFQFFVPIVQQAGQAAMLGRLSLIMCLWS
jgi:hypothetical protein